VGDKIFQNYISLHKFPSNPLPILKIGLLGVAGIQETFKPKAIIFEKWWSFLP
jgi:hypothetical protein